MEAKTVGGRIQWNKEFSKEEKAYKEIYSKFYSPDQIVTITNTQLEMGNHQYMGIDRVIVLKDGSIIRVEEKTRWNVRPEEDNDYGANLDICFEYGSRDSKSGKMDKGWIEKELHVDMILIYYVNVGRAFYYPFKMLQRVWFKNKESWLEKYPPKPNHRGKFLIAFIPESEVSRAIFEDGMHCFVKEYNLPEKFELTQQKPSNKAELEQVPQYAN